MKNKISGFKNETLYSYTDLKNIIYKEDIYVTDIGYFPNAKFHFVKRDSGCDENILIYVTSGSGTITLEKKIITLNSNDLIIIPAGIKHLYKSDDNQPWTIFWMHFVDSKILNESNYNINDIFQATFLKYLFSNMIHCLENKDQETMKYVNKNARLLLKSVEHYTISQAKKNNNVPEFDKFDDYIKLNLKNKISLEDLSNLSNYSYSHINKIFQEKYNISPIDYIIKAKLEHASILLETTVISISDIANLIGYEDPLYFSRIFKKKIGISPKKYRDGVNK